ncbi:MAG: FAD-binding dehydrogenase [Rhodocyclaceae bacterium]|nr:FAD-binding dehydrogenase [Rhodocyclaceae bacterium]
MQRYQADVIVVGGGLAGICATLELLDSGRKVLLLDRDIEANFGGQAKESFGGIFVVDSTEQRRVGFRDSPDLAYADWVRFGELDADVAHMEWPRRWARAYVDRCKDEVYLWVKKHGVRFVPAPHWIERGQFTPGNSGPRFHIVWGTGHGLIMHLLEALARHPRRSQLTTMFGQRVNDLLVDNGRITGCRGVSEIDGEAFAASAGATIITTGGVNGSIERVRQHWHADWGTPPEVLLTGAHKYADGVLHDAASRHGARVAHLDRNWNYAAGVHHWQPRKPHHGLSLVPPRSALWLNWQGERIGPQPLVTGFDTRDLVTQVCRQERQYSWQVLNRKIMDKEFAISGAEFNRSVRDKKILRFARELLLGNPELTDEFLSKCKDVVSAHNLSELVEKMNALNGDNAVNLATVQEVVGRYDEQIARGPKFHNDEQLRRIAYLRRWPGDKLRTCNFQPILDQSAMPLVAIREYVVCRKSLGGIQTDLSGRVVDTTGQAMPGLYAAGETTGYGGGGMNGLRALEGTFLGGCIFSGRIAGQAAASTT